MLTEPCARLRKFAFLEVKTGYCHSHIYIVRYIYYSSVDIRRIGIKLI